MNIRQLKKRGKFKEVVNLIPRFDESTRQDIFFLGQYHLINATQIDITKRNDADSAVIEYCIRDLHDALISKKSENYNTSMFFDAKPKKRLSVNVTLEANTMINHLLGIKCGVRLTIANVIAYAVRRVADRIEKEMVLHPEMFPSLIIRYREIKAARVMPNVTFEYIAKMWRNGG